MARPVSKRKIGYFPENYSFSPDIAHSNEQIILTHDELESMRLSDIEKLEQGKAAVKMGISRGTYQRILNTARKKTAEALVYGKKITIAGGEYSLKNCFAVCSSCGYKWDAPCNVLFYEKDGKCPECTSENITCSDGKGNCSLGERRHKDMLNAQTRQKYVK